MAKQHSKLISIKKKNTGKRQALGSHLCDLDMQNNQLLQLEREMRSCTSVTNENSSNSVSKPISTLMQIKDRIYLLTNASNKLTPSSINDLLHLEALACGIEQEIKTKSTEDNINQLNALMKELAVISAARCSLLFKLSKQDGRCKYLELIERAINRSKIKPAYLKFIHALALIKRIIEQIINNHSTYTSLEKLKPSIIRLSKGYNLHTPPAAPPHSFNLCNQIIHTVFEGTHYADFTPTRS